jgi:hypothetical protein
LIQVNLVYFCFFIDFSSISPSNNYLSFCFVTICFILIFNLLFLFSFFFFQFHSLILGCMGIEFRKFLFNLFSLKLFQSHVFSFFLRFQSSTLDLLKIEFYSLFFFHFLFMKLFWSYDLSCGFNKLARVDLTCFF